MTRKWTHEVVKGIQVLHAMHMVSGAWKNITSKTIQNCWIKGGFVFEREGIVEEGVIEHEEELSENNLITLPTAFSEKEIEAWVDIDSTSEVAKELDRGEQLKQLTKKICERGGQLEKIGEDKSDDVDRPDEPAPLAAEMWYRLHRLATGPWHHGFDYIQDFYQIWNESTEELRKKCSPKQSTWDVFF